MPTTFKAPERLEARVPKGTNEQLRAIAEREAVSVGALVRRAIRHLLLAEAERKRATERES